VAIAVAAPTPAPAFADDQWANAGIDADNPAQVKALAVLHETLAMLRGPVKKAPPAQPAPAKPAPPATPVPPPPTAVAAAPAPAAPQVPASTKVGLERLAELNELYMADKITPEQYHKERAAIISSL
jgi:hypothetical protein